VEKDGAIDIAILSLGPRFGIYSLNVQLNYLYKTPIYLLW